MTSNTKHDEPPETTGVTDVPTDEAPALAQEEVLPSVEHTSAAMIEGFTRAQKEIFEFLSERMRQDIETQAKLLRCRNLGEIRETQTRFFRTAMDQYAAEATKLMKIGAEMLASGKFH